MTEVKLFQKVEESTILIPLVSSKVHAGFESPASDYEEERIDLNAYVTKYPHATFYARVEGECMTGSGIFPDDLLVVDRSLKVTNGDVVIGVMDGDFILRTYLKHKGSEYLMPDNPNFSPIKRTPETQFEIWGVVPYTVLNQRKRRNVRIDRLQQLLCKL
ncbi:LexA family protein [Rubrolithibacter danxiaensis]|uniref:LexA family protein n=1 Tax=Rubrolithibacter danxiaensis TaxID=3390805 RepID=UPI003BF8EF69